MDPLGTTRAVALGATLPWRVGCEASEEARYTDAIT
jgi:hypothetical protein